MEEVEVAPRGAHGDPRQGCLHLRLPQRRHRWQWQTLQVSCGADICHLQTFDL
uniref:Uncharacterized protein n=1 Tax=Arundo donax TaxID=35708 RepID=A0A0A9G1V5_ARUDO